MKKNYVIPKLGLLWLILFTLNSSIFYAQSSDGCVSGNFGIDAGLYANKIEFGLGTPDAGSNDWFLGEVAGTGRGIISETDFVALRSRLQTEVNPLYERRMKFDLVSIQNNQILIDGIYARDYFGGTGARDATSFLTASKNGEDPAIWDPGESNVLGKNDIIDLAGHMFRDNITIASGNLWFVGLFNMAEPGGTAYMDFEFYVNSVSYNPGSGFTSGGPQLGHTAYVFENNPNVSGEIRVKKVGDFIFSISISGHITTVETRIWVKKTDWDYGKVNGKIPEKFDWTGTFDGPYNGSLYGYAGIKPKTNPIEICGYINGDGTNPLAPPWGVKGTKTNTWSATYGPNSLAEVAINLTALGMDHASLSGADPCYFPLNTFLVKTRASESFTAQLKDFAGPYSWANPTVGTIFQGEPTVSCDNLTTIISANPVRADVQYTWTTTDGNILGNANQAIITVDKPGTYILSSKLPTGCFMPSTSAKVTIDASKPFFNGPPTFSYTIPCNGTDGTITATASGATKPYIFTLYKDNVSVATATKGATESSHTFTGLAAGNYRVDVKGVYDCIETTGPIVIPAKIPVTITGVLTHVSCNGGKNGSIILTVSGGKAPLTYAWTNGNTTKDIINLGAGSYTVTVTDADGCKTIFPAYTITQPAILTGTIVKVNDTNPDPAIGNGSATLSVGGGTAAYSFSWVGPNSFTSSSQNITGLKYGQYTVTITDAKGCIATASVFIYEPEICNDGIDNDGDGSSDCLDSECFPTPPTEITPTSEPVCVGDTKTYQVTNVAGLTYNWTVPAGGNILSGQGTYTITVEWISDIGGLICVTTQKGLCVSVTSSCVPIQINEAPPGAGVIIINNSN